MTAILVKAPNWVGDCIMATPAFAFLRNTFPDARIDLLARPSVAGVLVGNAHITNVIVADERKLDAEVARQMRGSRYDAIALLTNSFSSAWLAWKLRIPRRIGFARGGRSILLTRRLRYRGLEWQTPTPKPLSTKSIPGAHPDPTAEMPHHMVEYYLRIAQEAALALGGRVYNGTERAAPRLHLTVDKEAAAKVLLLLESRGLEGKRLIGINPGAAYGGAKRWPFVKLAEVANAYANEGFEIVSTASKFESALTDQVQQLAPAVSIHRIGEELTLQELAALLPHIDLLVTNDSGPMHMAAALEVPTVAIFGPTDWNVTYPYHGRAKVVRHSPQCAPCFLRECPIDHRCMDRVTAEQVISAAREIMKSEQSS